ncbi:MAG: N-acetylneuraminate epimerase [Alphaproteobacteria bacterium ADurb.BinA280]|jgi:hypothetical protein|nr:MAG: N-acetylneuraminate epimerase [Alphaproteobacteria bacterium ADurb.BinA280]
MATWRHTTMALFLGLAAVGVASACALHLRAPQNRLHGLPKAANSAHWVGPAHSGSWFNPDRSGEGFILQIQDDATATLFWFTFPPLGSTDEQAWILGAGGVIEGDTIRFSQTFTTRGPSFGSEFDPADVQYQAWGSIRFQFSSCSEGQVQWNGPPEWGNGQKTLVRASAIDETGCDPKLQLTPTGTRAAQGLRQRSAAWFDPVHSGEGWVVEEFNAELAVIYWFSYDEQGRPAWMVGLGARQNDRFEFVDVLQPKGTHFGEHFDATAVQRLPWGSLAMQFTTCDRATLDYSSVDAAFGAGQLRPIRSNRLASTICRDAPGRSPAGGSWTQGNAMPEPQSEVAFARDKESIYVVAGFGDVQGVKRFDTLSGQWTVLPDLPAGRDHASAAVFGGDLFVTGGYPNGAGNQAENGWRYLQAENRWQHLPGLPSVEASGAATLDGYLYFASSAGELYQYDPRRDVSRLISGDGLLSRDHSQLVAFQGELWLLGGRSELNGETAAVSIYDPASERWRSGPRMLTTRGGFAAAASADAILVAGGEAIYGATLLRGEVEAIAAGEERWQALPPLPVALHGAAGALSGENFWVLGGSTRAGGIRNAGQVQIYRW